MGKAKTSAQILVDYATGELMQPSAFSFEKARKMRRDPTINLCRKYSIAPIIAANWAAEGDPRQVEFLEAQFQPIRNTLLRVGLNCEQDFGWKVFELIFGLADFTYEDGTVERLQMIQRVKPLKNDFTRFRYDKETGDFMGVSTVDQYTGIKIFIDAEHVLAINFDDEGLGNYGEGAMQVAERAHDGWIDADDAAARYDKKMAGTFLMVTFPVGETKYAKNNGALTDNYIIAEDAAKALVSTGTIIIPKDFSNLDANLPKEINTWEFKFLEPQAKQGSFVDRQKYLDALKVRAFALPERALIEGEFGTKAEASVHASAALLIRQQHHEDITELINRGPVNRLLKQNYGNENMAWLKAVPLTEDQNTFFTELLKTLIADPVAGPDIKQKIDNEAVLRLSGVPTLTDEHDEGGELTPVSDAQPVDRGATDDYPPPNGSPSPREMTISVSASHDVEFGGPGSGPQGGGGGGGEATAGGKSHKPLTEKQAKKLTIVQAHDHLQQHGYTLGHPDTKLVGGTPVPGNPGAHTGGTFVTHYHVTRNSDKATKMVPAHAITHLLTGKTNKLF